MKINVALLSVFAAFTVQAHVETWPLESVSDYHSNTIYQKSAASSLIARYVELGYLKPSDQVLDLCIECADGKIAADIAAYVSNGSVLAVDSSADMIDFARKNYEAGPQNLRFAVICPLHFNLKNRFDVVTSFTALHRIADQTQMLGNVFNALRENGKFLAQFPITHGFGAALDETIADPMWAEYFKEFSTGWHFVSANDYRQKLEEAGFKILRMEVTSLDEVYPSQSAFVASFRTWLPHLNAIPGDKRDAFLDDFMARYVAHVPLDQQGRLHYVVERLEVEAHR